MYKSRFFMQLSVFVFALFLFGGCGGNNSEGAPNQAPDVPTDKNTSTSIATMSIKGGSEKIASYNGETVTIEVRGLTKNNMLATEGNVLAVYLDGNSSVSGDLQSTTAAINNGIATFSYIAPPDIQKQIDSGNTGTSFKFYSEDDTSISTTVHITFDTSVDTGGSDPIASFTLSTYNFSVSESEENVNLKVTAKNSDGSYVANGKVGVKQISDVGNVDVGSTESEVSITNGTGTFIYTAPTDILNASTVSPVQFQVCDKINSNVCQIFTVNFTGGTTATPKLVVSNGSVKIHQDAENVAVKVLVTDSSGLPLKSGTIQVKYPEGSQIGIFAQSEVDIVDGVASFSYTGPDPIYYGAALFTFQFKENPSYQTKWSVSFIPIYDPVVVDPTYPIQSLSVNKNIIASTDGYTETIQVIALMAGNIPAPEGTIQVIYPDDVKTKNVGTISPSEATIANGIATFTYTGPTPLISDSNQTFKFKSKDYAVTPAEMVVSYSPTVDTANPKAKTLVIQSGNGVNITKNSEVVNIETRIYGVDNNPFDGGNVKIQFPNQAVNGVDVGYFSELIVPCVNGVANFTYNAPKNLSGRDNEVITFDFYHNSNPSEAHSALNFTIHPDANQTVVTNYTLTFSPADGNNTMGIESVKSFTAKVLDEDGQEISEGNYTIINLNPSIADLNDTSGAAIVPTTPIQAKNVNLRLTTKKLSGVVPIKINVSFIDVNGALQTLEQVFNIVVFSGPPTAMNIVYESSAVFDGSKFIEYFTVSAVDQYGNPINTRPYISMGALLGYATTVGGSEYQPNDYLYYTPDSAPTGKIDNASPDTFTATASVFTNVDQNGNDKLAVFGKDYAFNASGKWDFNYNSPTILELIDDYNGSTQTNLGFAVGHNYRPITCEPGNRALATVTSDDGSFQLDDLGMTKLKMIYDSYLVGKDIVVWTNILGQKLEGDQSVRIGSAIKHTLRGQGLSVDDAFTPPPSQTGTVRFFIDLKDPSIEHYYNARFSYKVEAGQGTTVNSVIPSYTATADGVADCTQSNGWAYIDVSYTSSAIPGAITVKDVVVANEF